MARKLKVFRSPIGFHDAYVAAPSRKAALEAWGATADLFARGTAEQVTDARLTAEPLKHPGRVIRVSRGDLQAQIKALGPRKSRPKPRAPSERARKPPAPKPPPKRDKVDQAEAELAKVRQAQAKELAALEKQREGLQRKVDALAARQDKAIDRLEQRLDKAKAQYRAALDKWSG